MAQRVPFRASYGEEVRVLTPWNPHDATLGLQAELFDEQTLLLV